VEQNEQRFDEASRWVLYHGTSTARLKRILAEGRLRRATIGDQKIALTTERSVAEYFACKSVFGDRHDRPNEESTGVVLVLDGEGLLALNYDLAEFRDPIWGDGECDWENEIECRDDIDPLAEVLITTEPVPSERYGEYIERGRASPWRSCNGPPSRRPRGYLRARPQPAKERPPGEASREQHQHRTKDNSSRDDQPLRPDRNPAHGAPPFNAAKSIPSWLLAVSR
jgi:hypothetical protein